MIDIAVLATPIGAVTAAARGSLVCALFFRECVDDVRRACERWYPGETAVERADAGGLRGVLETYFGGRLDALDDVEVELNGTPFQRRVWTALRSIKAGETWSYRDLAVRIGAPAAVRAVGAANGANPVAIVVPCHRVIGSNGTLTGYGGGLEIKSWLLRHEQGTLFP